MNPIDWLCANANGFAELSLEEREVIMHFSLLWGFFEAEALSNAASVNSILALVRKLESENRLNTNALVENLAYFKERYFPKGKQSQHFSGLYLRQNDNIELVKSVLKSDNTSASDCVAVLLIIVYRLRNNLFHGVKWAYGIRGQLENFTHANTVLMRVLEMRGHR